MLEGAAGSQSEAKPDDSIDAAVRAFSQPQVPDALKEIAIQAVRQLRNLLHQGKLHGYYFGHGGRHSVSRDFWLAGQIRRGTSEEITAVLWSSDLRGFTERSDRYSGEQVITLLNALFDAQAKAIADHGGEILKFIGDGLLSIFPIESLDLISVAAENALAAAIQAVEAAKALSSDGEPKLEIETLVLQTGSILPSSDLR